MYPDSEKDPVHRSGPRYSGETRERPGLRTAYAAVPRRLDRILLLAGAISLALVVPMLWLWIAYGGALSPDLIWAGGIGLSAIVAGIGLGMIRILDGHR
jgi:hypothetical protein